MLAFVLRNRPPTVSAAIMVVVLSALLATRMGAEFVPSLNEADIALHALRVPGTSLSQAVEMQQALESRIKAFPEVDRMFAKIGTAEIATDPMPPSVADNFVMLKPQSQWPDPKRSKDDLVKAMQEVVGEITGAADVKLEQITGLPVLTVHMDRQKISRYGLNVAELQEVIEVAVGDKEAGQVFEGDRRFDLLVRLPERLREDTDALRRQPLPLPGAGRAEGGGEARPAYVNLGELAQFDVAPGPNQVSRENGKRRAVVTANVRGRDLGSFVAEARQRIASQIKLPEGYWLDYGGTFEQLASPTASRSKPDGSATSAIWICA